MFPFAKTFLVFLILLKSWRSFGSLLRGPFIETQRLRLEFNSLHPLSISSLISFNRYKNAELSVVESEESKLENPAAEI